MKGLIIKSPHIDNICRSNKTWELRGSPTKIRGKIALIKSGTKTIVAYADLLGCIGPLTPEFLALNVDRHMASGVTKYKKTYAWILANVRGVEKPIPYKHPQGAIIWVNL